MEQGYRKIFWGLLIVLFNINVGPLNILPDLLVKSQRNYTVLLIIGLILISISFNISSEIYIGVTAVYVLIVEIYFATIISGIRKMFVEQI